MTNGTGAGIGNFDLPSELEIAGKTGTTNDNSDAWFMGYTPQLLAGGWVGADDRFIRFKTESKNGEGGRAAMPIWAYFMKSVAADPYCGLDTKLTFVKPESMANDIQINFNEAVPIPTGEDEEMGTSKSGDYEVPVNIKAEDIGPESDTKLDAAKTPLTNPKPGDKDTKKPGDKPATLPSDKKPKGVMPALKKQGVGN